MRLARARAAALFAAILVLAGCTRSPDNPEDEIRAFLSRVETAVRERDAGAIKDLIADDYADAEKRDKRALTSFVALQFLREGSLHVATRLRKSSFPQRNSARVEVLAALGRTEIDLTSLPNVDADVYVVDLDLRREDGDWLVTRAEWHPATVEDL